MGERQIGLRKRTRPFTSVPNDVVDDWTIGYRELGILVRILRMPDGFVIRSDQLSTEGKGRTMRGREGSREGREAVRTALRNLALAGYYRLVRQRTLDGTFEMATDITEDPDEVWAAQARVFGGKPVPLVEQPDGTYLVKYPDGQLLADDVPPPATLEPDSSDEPDKPSHSPKPRNPSSENRAPGNPASGNPASGFPGPLNKMVSKDGQKDSVPAPQVRRPTDDEAPDGQIDIDGNVGLSEAEKARQDAEKLRGDAQKIARGWVEFRAAHNCPVVMSGRQDPQMVLAKNFVLPALTAGYTETEIKNALMWCDTGVPSKPQFESGLTQVRSGWHAGRGWKPGDGRDRGNNVRRRGGVTSGENRHIDDITDQQRQDENPFAGASRQSDYAKGAVA